MTDKEMIINGVDVSECEFLWKEKLPKKVCNNGNIDCDCNSNPNCCFKQLARAKEEIEELRTHCKHIDETNKILYNEKVQLLDKNQELQDKLLKLSDLAHEVLLYELQTLDIDFDEYETHVRDTEFSPIVTRCSEMIDLIGYSNNHNKEV